MFSQPINILLKNQSTMGTLKLIKAPSQINQPAAQAVLVDSFIGEYQKYLKPEEIGEDLTSWRDGEKSVQKYYEDYFKTELGEFTHGILHYWVEAKVKGILVGWATFQREVAEQNAVYMNLLVVRPEYQAKGIGEQLVKALITLQVIPELSAIHLLLRKKNQGGRAFYSKLGFKFDPEYQRADNFVDINLLEPFSWSKPAPKNEAQLHSLDAPDHSLYNANRLISFLSTPNNEGKMRHQLSNRLIKKILDKKFDKDRDKELSLGLLYTNGPLTSEMAEAFAEAFSADTHFTSLILDGINLSNLKVLTPIAEIIKKNKTLTKLSLENCKIPTLGLSILAAALEENNTLQEVNLSKNIATNELAASFFDKFNGRVDVKPRVFFQSTVRLNEKRSQKETEVSYVINHVLPILQNEKQRLTNKYGDRHERVTLLAKMLKDMNSNLDLHSMMKEEGKTELQAHLKASIQKHLSEQSLDKYPGWASKLGLTLLNLLTFLPVVTMIAKRVLTGSWLFSTTGKSQEAADETLKAIDKLALRV